MEKSLEALPKKSARGPQVRQDNTGTLAGVSHQVRLDLKQYLGSSSEAVKRLAFMAKKIGIHRKTLRRLARGEHAPHYTTVFKIYRFLLDEHNPEALLEKSPPVVATYLQKMNFKAQTQGHIVDGKLETLLRSHPVALEIYILCGTGPLPEKEILHRYGQCGMQLASSLLEAGFLVRSKKDPKTLRLSEQKVLLSPETVVKMGAHCFQQFAGTKKGNLLGQHFVGFYAEGLSPQAYQKWMKIDQEAHFQKIEIARDPQSAGPLRAFTISATDTLAIKE